jgi:hypothetical protein
MRKASESFFFFVFSFFRFFFFFFFFFSSMPPHPPITSDLQKQLCDYNGDGYVQSGEGVCRGLENCLRDWPIGMNYQRFRCTGPEDVICCKAVCQYNTGNWTTCTACPGAVNIETRAVTIVDDQGFGVDVCLRSVARERPCSLPCPSTLPGATTTATTTTTTTTTTRASTTTTERLTLPSGVTAEPDTTTESTAPFTGTVPVKEVTTTVPVVRDTTVPPTQVTTNMGQQSNVGTSNPSSDIGVEPWIIGVAAGGGLLLLICCVVCLVCVARRRRSAYHSDREEPPGAAADAAQMRPISTYASPTALAVVEYDMVPPETAEIDAAIDRSKSHSYTMLGPEHGAATADTPIVYDQTLASDDRFSMAPKY